MFFKPKQNLYKLLAEFKTGHFQVKLRSEACLLDFQNIFQNRLCKKSCYELFIKQRSVVEFAF